MILILINLQIISNFQNIRMATDIITATPNADEMVEFNEDYLRELEEQAKGRYGPDDKDYNEVSFN